MINELKVCPHDKQMSVLVLASTPEPEALIWQCAHQCVSENPTWMTTCTPYPGASVVKHLLSGNRGHYSPLEAPAITFCVAGWPHSTMQQITRHRTGVHFSVQSFRYTGDKIVDVANLLRPVTSVFYLRPAGEYLDRSGIKYLYTEEQRDQDIGYCYDSATKYKRRIDEGHSHEHCRSLIPFDVRQDFCMTLNVRSLMHILDLRAKKDAQLEIQWLSELLFECFEEWCPHIAMWYKENRLGKARLSP
jgi:thymidylate synthase, flavin-dependent